MHGWATVRLEGEEDEGRGVSEDLTWSRPSSGHGRSSRLGRQVECDQRRAPRPGGPALAPGPSVKARSGSTKGGGRDAEARLEEAGEVREAGEADGVGDLSDLTLAAQKPMLGVEKAQFHHDRIEGRAFIRAGLVDCAR